MVVAWPVCWVAWAGLAGGLTYRVLGLSLVLANGRRAWRLQWVWRALVVWGRWRWRCWGCRCGWTRTNRSRRWSWASWGSALMILFGVAVLALRLPAAGCMTGSPALTSCRVKFPPACHDRAGRLARRRLAERGDYIKTASRSEATT